MSADTIYASGFGTAWDGTYTLRYTDHWSNGDYWVYRDSYYWYITDSEFLYGDSHAKAQMEFEEEVNPEGNLTGIINPRGSYTGISGEPSGVIV